MLRRLTWRDAAAVLLVAALIVPFVGYIVRGTMPFVHDARGMGATILILASAAVLLLGADAFGEGTFRNLALGVGVIAAVMAVIAIAVETVDVLLIPAFAAAIVLCAMLISHDAGWLPARVHHRRHG